MHLDELLAIEDSEERDRQLRRAFSPATALVEVAGSELKVLTILCNLTFKRADVSNLLCVAQAKQALSDPIHFERCLNEVRWFHSHNLKYPDSRVSHQRLVLPRPYSVPGAITSSEEPKLLGWSHNSSEVNRAKLFCAAFLVDGEATCLALQLKISPSRWLPRFGQRAMPAATRKLLAQRVSELLPEESAPEEVSSFSKQIRVFDGEDYRSITPVVSHGVQCKIHQLAYKRKLRATTIEHAHPASVGDLVASQGGRCRALFYPPAVYQNPTGNLSAARQKRLQQGRTVFDYRVLRRKTFLSALEQVIGTEDYKTLREQRKVRVAALRIIRIALAEWLGPMLEWRDAYEEQKSELKMPEGIEKKLLEVPQHHVLDLLVDLSNRLQEELQLGRLTRAYAYHPRLMNPLKSQLRWLLGKLARDEELKSDESAEITYLRLSNLRVFDAQALGNPYVVGIPSLSALWGLIHNFEYRLAQLLRLEIKVISTAWHVRQYSLNESKPLPEPKTPQTSRQSSAIKRPGIVDNKLCDMTMDLVLKLRVPLGEKPLSARDLNLIQAAFPSRFAGGCLQPPCLFEQVHWCRLFTEPEELFDELKRLPRGGVWVYPTNEQITTLNELPELLAAKPNYRPASVGFMALEEPQSRMGSIAPTHCYAEPVMGLVECVGPIEVRLAGVKSFLEGAFWQMDVSGRAMLLRRAP